MAKTPIPVSYTHLDVYKRQALGISNLRVYASIQNPFHITSYSGLDPEATMGSPLVPVSYTHLEERPFQRLYL